MKLTPFHLQRFHVVLDSPSKGFRLRFKISQQQKLNTPKLKPKQHPHAPHHKKTMHRLLPLLHLLTLTHTATADAGTTCEWTSDDGVTVDLSSMTKTGPDFYTHVEGNFEFKLNLCGEVDSSTCKNHDAAGIQVLKADNECVAVLGSATEQPTSWAKLEPPHDGFALSFAGGDPGCSTAPFTRSLTYDMVCDNTLEEAQLLSVVENPTCVYTAIWKINCRASGAHGMTGAVKMCIILFILLLAYVGVFVYLERKESGQLRLPETHTEYWREFFLMAQEGAAISIEKAKEIIANRGFSGSSGGGSAGGGSGGSGSSSGYDAVPTTEKGGVGQQSYGSGGGNDLSAEHEDDIFGDDNL